MSAIPKSLVELIEALSNLPGVGQRTSERYAYFLLRAGPEKSSQITEALSGLHKNVSYCPVTFALIEKGQRLSPLYESADRDKSVIAVVSDPFDVVALEATNSFKGTYHVLGGLISPIDGVGPEQLHIQELIARLDKDKVSELILAINASVESETTALYITQQIGERPLKITRLARGLPIGVDLEYADQITLTSALEGRQAL
jgi:recombination protein RecR